MVLRKKHYHYQQWNSSKTWGLARNKTIPWLFSSIVFPSLGANVPMEQFLTVTLSKHIHPPGQQNVHMDQVPQLHKISWYTHDEGQSLSWLLWWTSLVDLGPSHIAKQHRSTDTSSVRKSQKIISTMCWVPNHINNNHYNVKFQTIENVVHC